jgi:hypothetical protein
LGNPTKVEVLGRRASSPSREAAIRLRRIASSPQRRPARIAVIPINASRTPFRRTAARATARSHLAGGMLMTTPPSMARSPEEILVPK